MELMPALFIGHGSPMNAIEDNEFSRAWIQAGRELPPVRAVVCISAHWETNGTRVLSVPAPRTIYDFYGFPPQLYRVEYPAPGSPDLAERVRSLIRSVPVQPDLEWGLDHGCWSVLKHLLPEARVPVIQLSLDQVAGMQQHYDLGRQLAELRQEGVLILGSGNMVHNLRVLNWSDIAFDWALAYDEMLRAWIESGDHEPVIQYEKHGSPALQAVNSAEHYEPLLYILALQQAGEAVRFFAERVTLGSISMRSLRIG
jgi:4,5-DOPA dioxygenase extradiol